MKYSVVIPLYNKEHFIKATLQSVLEQSYEDFEILVIDDGSTDQSVQIVNGFQSDKIHLIQQRNQGVAVARNTGVFCAKGEFIAFLDADDKWEQDYLLVIDELVEKYKQCDIYVTAYQIDMGNGKMNYSTQLQPEIGCLDSYWLTLEKGYDFVWTSATTIRKQAIIDVGGFKPGEKIGQDLDLWARVAKRNPKVAYSAKRCATYMRAAEFNARTRIKIAYAEAFMKDLEEEMGNWQRTKEELCAIQSKYDKKKTVYIFTCIMAKEKKRALYELKHWKGKKTKRNCILKMGLYTAWIMPSFVNRWIYNIRLKVF